MSRPAPRPRTRLACQFLEDRTVPSWAGMPPAAILPPAAAKIAVTNTKTTATGSSAITRSEVDYRSFIAPTSGQYQFEASTPVSDLDPVIGVFDASGQRVAFNNDLSGTDTDSSVTADIVAGNKYYVGITNRSGTLGGKYSWKVVTAGTDDRYDENDTAAKARQLGRLSGLTSFNHLILRDRADWYKFSFKGLADGASEITLAFSHAVGDLDVQLFDSSGNLVRSSTGTTDAEIISLESLVGDTFYLHVYGYNGAINPDYDLGLNISASPIPAGSRVLYLNTEGASISRAALERYAADWDLTDPDDFDSDRNGIRVNKFLAGQADRTAIINRMIQLVQEDLRPYGITVKRHTGAAVENRGATTIFLGESTLSNGSHIACDIDLGNDNRTDIAFVGDEEWGSAENTAIAMADVTLHEAGHTWGLWHVASGLDAETMGLRYNNISDLWIQNTSFRNVTYAQFSDHGPGPQNAHQTMRQNFGLVAASRRMSSTFDLSVDGLASITTVGPADRVAVRRLESGTVEITVNGRAYRIAEGLREVRIATGGDTRDRVTIDPDLGDVLVSVGDESLTAKIDDASTDYWRGRRGPDDGLPCMCPSCTGARPLVPESAA